MNVCMLATAQPTLYTYMVQSLVQEMMLPTCKVAFPVQLAQMKAISYRHAQRTTKARSFLILG